MIFATREGSLSVKYLNISFDTGSSDGGKVIIDVGPVEIKACKLPPRKYEKYSYIFSRASISLKNEGWTGGRG